MSDNRPRRKEAVGSILILAQQGSFDFGQWRGCLEREDDCDSKKYSDSDDETCSTATQSSLGEAGSSTACGEKSNDVDCFIASKAKRYRQNAEGDNDIWIEAKVIVNKRTGRMRSYFYSKNTQCRQWDEPPTGASKVIYLKDLRRVYLREKTHRWASTQPQQREKRRRDKEKQKPRTENVTASRSQREPLIRRSCYL